MLPRRSAFHSCTFPPAWCHHLSAQPYTPALIILTLSLLFMAASCHVHLQTIHEGDKDSDTSSVAPRVAMSRPGRAGMAPDLERRLMLDDAGDNVSEVEYA